VIEQRTPEWFEARRGKPTASQFSKILTSKLKPSKSAEKYMNELLLEKLGRPMVQYVENDAMRIGIAREPNGVAAFELVTGIETEEAGFMLSECGRFGASPDRTWDDGVLELKCPLEKTHKSYSLEPRVPTKYVLQLRSQMMIADKPIGYFCSYHPDHLPHVVRVERDPEWDQAFQEGLKTFLDELDSKYEIACNNILS